MSARNYTVHIDTTIEEDGTVTAVPTISGDSVDTQGDLSNAMVIALMDLFSKSTGVPSEVLTVGFAELIASHL